MRPTVLLLAALAWLAAASTALAADQVAPPGNSGVDQYVESVPASSGNRPVGPASSGGELRRSAARKLSATGADGRAAARALGATAPQGRALGATAPAHPRAPRRASPRKAQPRSGHAMPARSPAPAGGDSKGGTLLKAAATGAGGGGIGLLLPILLVGTLVAAGAFALFTRRWRTG